MGVTSQALAIAEKQKPTPPPKAKPKAFKSRRNGQQLIAEIEYGDGDTTGLPIAIISGRDPSGAMIGIPQYSEPNRT
jgi:hypothetical protein